MHLLVSARFLKHFASKQTRQHKLYKTTNIRMMSCLVSCQWLSEQMDKPDWHKELRVLDATWDLPGAKRDCKQEHVDCRIPAARFFSLKDCSDKNSTLPHMLPSASEFEDFVSSLGVSNKHHVVVYDNSVKYGLFSAARAWWMFRIFGHNKVSVLDGGLPKWIKEGFKTVTGDVSGDEILPDPDQRFEAFFRSELVTDLSFMVENCQKSDSVQVMDARGNDRFRGTADEPRAGAVSGHIPQSKNVHFARLLDPDTKAMRQKEEIANIFSSSGIDLEKNVIASCGSGVTACVLALGAFYSSGNEVTVYDGSWTDWSKNAPKQLIEKD